MIYDFLYENSLVRNSEAIYARIGDYDLTSSVASRGAQTQRVGTTYIHHNHNGQTLDNGIVVENLENFITLNLF